MYFSMRIMNEKEANISAEKILLGYWELLLLWMENLIMTSCNLLKKHLKLFREKLRKGM